MSGITSTDGAHALYAGIIGEHHYPGEPEGTGAQLLTILFASGGNVSEAARRVGVPRRTMRNWLSGAVARPSGDRADRVGQVARQIIRRDRLSRGREQQIRGGSLKMKIAALCVLNTPGKANTVTGLRTKDVGAHFAPGAMDQVLDAWLDGSDGTDELHDAIDRDYCDPELFQSVTRIWFE